MRGVYFCEIIDQTFNECISLKITQIIFARKAAQLIGKVRFDMLRQGENVRLCDAHRADITGPRIYVLEDASMKRPKVVEVVLAIEATLAELGQRYDSDVGFCRGKTGRIADVELVPEDFSA
jgi:hypothetical protein